MHLTLILQTNVHKFRINQKKSNNINSSCCLNLTGQFKIHIQGTKEKQTIPDQVKPTSNQFRSIGHMTVSSCFMHVAPLAALSTNTIDGASVC